MNQKTTPRRETMPRRVSWRGSIGPTFLAVLLLLGLCAVPNAQADDKAQALAQKTLDAMGGQEAWDATRFLRFNFFGFRLHHWDRETGRHRFEGKTRDGDAYLVLHNLNTREGKVWMNGELQSGDDAKTWLDRAHSAWINDTYWLLMPYKLRDPGVHLVYDGEETLDGTTYDTLKLTFDNVGLTPGDQYWAYINRDTGLMDRWAYHLEGWEADRPATHWWWKEWEKHGGIQLASSRVNPDPENGGERRLDELAVFDHLPDAVFESETLPEF